MVDNFDLGRRLLVLEGGEGAGKSSCMQAVCSYLEQKGLMYIRSREPGGTEMAEQIRALLLTDRQEQVHAMTELLLVFAARVQHLQEKILPALHQGWWVVLDRFTEASYAYQGGGRQLGQEVVALLENLVQGTLRPGRIFWLDVPVDVGLDRVQGRPVLDRLDRESLSFMQRVHQVYVERCQQNPCYQRIDASLLLDQVQSQLVHALATYVDEVQSK